MSSLAEPPQIPPDLLAEWGNLVRHHGAASDPTVVDAFLARHDLTPDAIGPLLAALATSYSVTGEPLVLPAADPPGTASTPTPTAGTVSASPTPMARPAQTSSEDLADAFEDLFGDWARAGQLTDEQIAVTATDYELTPSQLAELRGLLRDAGVKLDRPVSASRYRDEERGGIDSATGDSVRRYLRQIARYRLIDAGREVELSAAIFHGAAARAELDASSSLPPGHEAELRSAAAAGERAHAELVCANLRLVVSVARRHGGRGVDFADLIQFGNVGLLRAADKFDGSLGYKFSTYATWWIRQAITRGIADTGRIIRIPVHMVEKINKVRGASRRLAHQLDREPTVAEVAECTGFDPGEVQAIRDLDQPVISLDAPVSVADGELVLADIVADTSGRSDPAASVSETTLHHELVGALDVLSEREAGVIGRRYGLDGDDEQTLEVIGMVYGVTRERIRQIEGRSMTKLRSSKKIAALHTYLSDGPVPQVPILDDAPTGKKAS